MGKNMSFLKKNLQKEIVQNVNVWVKMDIFAKKMGKTYFFQYFNQAITVKDNKYSFNTKQQQNPTCRQGEIGKNVNFCVKMVIYLVKNGLKNNQK